MMDQEKEQQMCIKLCTNLGKSATETHTIIKQAFRDQILNRKQVFQWHARFKTGRTSVDNEHTGRPTNCQLLKLLHKFKSSSVNIDVRPFTTLLRRWELVMERASGF
jgi:hypothetical protein